MADETTDTAAEKPAAKAPVARPSREDNKCTVANCKRPYKAKGYCIVHYKAWRVGDMEGHKGRYKICTKEACRKPRALGSLCAEHSKKTEAAA